MKKSHLYELKNGIDACAQFKGGKFQYALAKNAKKIKSELEAIELAMEKAYPLGTEYQEYQEKLMELQIQFCKKDDAGVVQANDQGFILFSSQKDKILYEAARDELKKLYSATVETSEEIIKSRKEFLNQDCDPIEWQMIKAEDIPEDANGALLLIEDFLQ